MLITRGYNLKRRLKLALSYIKTASNGVNNLLLISQLVVSVVLIALILLQQRGTALGSAFGQGEGGFYGTLRGVQKKIFWATVVMGFLFVVLAIANLVL